MKIIEKIFNLETQTETLVERDMTAEELTAYDLGIKELQELQKLQVEREVAKERVLQKLGLTEDEAKLLLS